ncbi:hypothetical protein D3C73_1322920 [compost metagenome]
MKVFGGSKLFPIVHDVEYAGYGQTLDRFNQLDMVAAHASIAYYGQIICFRVHLGIFPFRIWC